LLHGEPSSRVRRSETEKSAMRSTQRLTGNEFHSRKGEIVVILDTDTRCSPLWRLFQHETASNAVRAR
jgi:hypothetical protein